MNHPIRRVAQSIFTALGLAVALMANASAETRVDPPKWISEVPVLRSGNAESFQFRANMEMFGIHLIAYVSWAPPDHRAVILCDGSDGLPLLISVDGHAWTYDLVSGQILRGKDEPSFEVRVKNERVDFAFGTKPAGQSGSIHVDFASIFSRKSAALQTTEDSKGRVATFASSESEGTLRVTSSNPPRPTSVLFVIPSANPPARIEFDAFRFGAPIPQWHHSLDTEALVRDVPYCDMEDMKDFPKEKQEMLEASKHLMLAGATFLIRPAIHDLGARQKLEGLSVKIDFKQMELHEKLLSKAWLGALKHQGIDPAKLAAGPMPIDGARAAADAAPETSKTPNGLNPALVVIDLGRVFAGHPEMEKAQREFTARFASDNEARQGEIAIAKKLAGEVAELDGKLANSDLGEIQKKELARLREDKDAEVRRINERTAAVNTAMEKWKAAKHDEIVKNIESALHGLSNGGESVIVLDKSASSSNKVPAVVFSSEAMEISEKALEAIRSGKPISPDVIKNVPRKLRIAGVDLYKVFNSVHQTTEVNDKIDEVVRSSNAEIKARMDSLTVLMNEVNRLASEVQQTGLDDPQKEEKKKVLNEKAKLLQKGDEELKKVESARDRQFTEIKEAGMVRVPREMQKAVAELARKAGADLVLDSTGQNSGGVAMALHFKGIPDWTESVIEKMNSASLEAKSPDDAPLNQTISSEKLRFGILDFQRVLSGTPAGEAFKRKEAETTAKLKELAAKEDNEQNAKDAIFNEGRAALDSIVAAANNVIAAQKGAPDFNIVFEIGGKTDNGTPLAVSYDHVPDLTEMVIKALTEKGQ